LTLRRVATCLTVYLALVPPGDALAQCRKRVLVYLDQSGSMDPQRRQASSFYGRVFDAVQDLLRSPGFLGPKDRVWVLPFGEGISNSAAEAGAADWPARLRPLRQLPGRSHTDLVAVLAHVAEQLGPTARFDQQVAIIASDFVHAPAGGRASTWRDGFDRVRQELVSTLPASVPAGTSATPAGATGAGSASSPSGNALVLVLAPGTLGRAQARTVVDDLHAVGARSLSTSGAEGVTDMAQALRRSMGRTPRIVSVEADAEQRHASGRQRVMHIVAENPGCVGTRIERLTVRCGSDVVSEPPLPEERRALAPRGDAAGQSRLEIALPDQDCQSGFSVALTTAEGEEVAEATPTGIKLDLQVERQVLTPRFLAPKLLVIDTQARGYLGAATGATFELADAEGVTRLVGPLARVPGLDPREWRPVRFQVPLPGERADHVRGGQSLIFRARTAASSPRGTPQPVVADLHATRAFLLAKVVVGVGLLALLAAWLHGRHTPGWMSPDEAIDWVQRVQWIVSMTSVSGLAFGDQLDVLEGSYVIGWGPLWPLLVAAAAGVFCAYYALRWWHDVRCQALVRAEASPPADVLARLRPPVWHRVVVVAAAILPLGYYVWAEIDASRTRMSGYVTVNLEAPAPTGATGSR
jgi:hypothetical protein